MFKKDLKSLGECIMQYILSNGDKSKLAKKTNYESNNYNELDFMESNQKKKKLIIILKNLLCQKIAQSI